MPADRGGTYLDANVLLAYISDERGRAGVVDQLLARAASGNLRLFTSTLSIVEVAFGAGEKVDREFEPTVEATIDALWQPGSVITLAEPSVPTLTIARRYVRRAVESGRSVKPLDAVHLATAVAAKVDRLLTYEEEPRRAYWAELTGLAVEEPSVAQMPLL